MELSKRSKASVGIYIIERSSIGSFNILDTQEILNYEAFNILDTQEILNYEVENMAKAAYSMFSGVIIIWKCWFLISMTKELSDKAYTRT
jgi:hypothetical protein